ncbi:class I SAM-dependent methyltransferase [Oscillatoria sp. FACHB-1407]|uniref:class I SAM-dependent methyltransferase n=1 Tax=Oscillatoria sp. FACHB-1407 TaxID=2692847 RepID=UPI00168749AE|nr:class I SAM-dependent methyltransferase [Oscillatoria sp. FACHB-1407]MBD2459909.1 class I SAM-dependent methyltransferase [Oscillatoria sp. FACHB-1407]
MPDLQTSSGSPFQSSQRWADYYNAVAGRPPRDTLIKALEQFDSEPFPDSPRFAVDLGCGDGRDTVELLQRGWRVLGIDGEAEAIARLRDRPDVDLTHLETQVIRFEALTLPHSVDLMNASFCLPFCPPEHFATLWETIVTALKPGGRFCGQLFGDRDSWATIPTMTHHTRSQVENLLRSFEVEWLNEEEHPGKTALNEDKYWHLFHIVARRKSP